MKTFLLITLAASAVLNAVLLIRPPAPAELADDPRALSRARSGVARGADGASDVRKASPLHQAALAQVCDSLESSDLATMRDRLRAAGFPERVVRALVGRRIDAPFEARRLGHYGPLVVEPYWKTRDPAVEKAHRAFERAISREQRAMYTELLGPGTYGPEARFVQHQNDFLPPEKAAALLSIEQDYGELHSEVRGESSSPLDLPEDREQVQLLQREKEADIAAVLSPEEYELYQLHRSPTAHSVRNRLRAFEPTEEEFLAIYALQKVIDERYPMSSAPRTPENSRARSAAQAEMETQLRSVLGDERFPEYERSRSPSYRLALRIADHLTLPRDVAVTIHGMDSEYKQRRNEVMESSRSPADKSAALKALATEAGARVDALLTTEGGKAFRGSGTWLRNLEQQAQRSPASGATSSPSR